MNNKTVLELPSGTHIVIDMITRYFVDKHEHTMVCISTVGASYFHMEKYNTKDEAKEAIKIITNAIIGK